MVVGWWQRPLSAALLVCGLDAAAGSETRARAGSGAPPTLGTRNALSRRKGPEGPADSGLSAGAKSSANRRLGQAADERISTFTEFKTSRVPCTMPQLAQRRLQARTEC